MSRRNPSEPYWLIRYAGHNHGIGTVSLDLALTAQNAVDAWAQAEAEQIRALGLDVNDASAELVVLTYDQHNQPHVTPVG